MGPSYPEIDWCLHETDHDGGGCLSSRYSSVLDCVARTYSDEGIRGFFRGVWLPLLTITFVRTASFSKYQRQLRLFCTFERD